MQDQLNPKNTDLASKSTFAPPVVSFVYDRYTGAPAIGKYLKRFKALLARKAELSTPDQQLDRILSYILIFIGGLTILSISFLFSSIMLFFLPIPAFFCILGLFLIYYSAASRAKITLDHEGLAVQKIFCLINHSYKWSDLQSIIFAQNGIPSTNSNELILSFRNNGRVSLELNALTQEKLMAIINVALFYKPTIELLPQECQSIFRPNQLPDNENENFTEIWQSDFERRSAPTSFVPLEQGTKLQKGNLEIVGQIASGGMSAIYLAKHTMLKTVVIKESVIPGAALSEIATKAAELFHREAILLSLIDHPRIVRIYDYFVENDRHYLLLEHLQGRTMRAYVARNGPVEEKLAIDWALQSARILEYLHNLATPIIHRDYTPDNLIISADTKLRVVDFGASSTFLSTATGTIIGKMAYMAPEQLKGKATTASDIFALGGVMRFLMTGADPKPYEDNALPPKTIAKYPHLAPIAQRCTEPKLSDRFGTCQELIRRLEHLSTGDKE